MAQVIKRAYKYRFRPTPEQAELLNRTFGCLRLVWNKAPAERTRRYKDEGRRTSYVDTARWLTAWKQDEELSFLREVSNVPLQQCLRAQQVAFNNIVWHRPLPEGVEPSTVAVSQDGAGRWFVSLLVEEIITPLPIMRDAVGIDDKSGWYGRELLLVDRWFPSSQPCSAPQCGRMNQKMPLNVRSWTGPQCGIRHDRDVNAAMNILAAGPADK